MKRINLSAICAAALLLAIPFAGCGQGDSGSIQPHQDVEITQENDNNGENTGSECPDGKCKDGKCKDGKCKDGKCPEDKLPEDRGGRGGKCPGGKCPKAGGRLPHGKKREGKPLPCPIDGDNGNN